MSEQEQRQPDERKQRSPSTGPGPPQGPLSASPYWLWAVAVALFTAYWLTISGGEPRVASISYSELKQAVRNEEVASVTFKGERITGRYVEGREAPGAAGGQPAQRFETVMPSVNDPVLMELLEQHDVEVRAESTEAVWWVEALISVLPWILLIGLIFYFSKKMQERMSQGGGMFGFGRSKARRYTREDSAVTFDDVAGAEGAKRDLAEIVEYLKNPDRYQALGAKIPKGVLLMGAPGTGKTLFAKAVAGEANVPFYSISGSEFIEMFVGVGASRVRDMFANAKQEAPAIVFIDEIDSVGRSRGTGVGGGHDEREQTLNQILSEMDGFSPHESVVVIAATNRPDVLDPALMRPGRFDRKVTLERPGRDAREKILQVHTRKVPLAEDVDLATVAARTVGFAGADLENLVNEAALLAGRKGQQKVDMAAFDQARDKIVLGAEREGPLGEEEKKVVAYHESGHALLAALLAEADPPDKVTIIPRGQALGATEQTPEEDRYNLRQRYIEDRIGVMLGGRLSEQIIFGEVTTGSEQDLKQATELARRMVSQWGMSDELGAVAYRQGESHVFLGKEMAEPRDYSERTAQLIDDEVRRVISAIEDRCRELMEKRRDRLEALAEALLERETLDAAEIRAIVEQRAAS